MVEALLATVNVNFQPEDQIRVRGARLRTAGRGAEGGGRTWWMLVAGEDLEKGGCTRRLNSGK